MSFIYDIVYAILAGYRADKVTLGSADTLKYPQVPGLHYREVRVVAIPL